MAPCLILGDSRTIPGPRNFLRGYPAIVAPGSANAVVETPASSVDKWEVKSDNGDPLDVLVLGAGVPRGSVIPVREQPASTDVRSITELND